MGAIGHSEICNALKIKVSEIFELANDAPKEAIRFNKKQEDAFVKNQSLYNYFVALLETEYNERKLRQQTKISASSSQKYLLKLDGLNLIELGEKNKITPVFKNVDGIGISARLAGKVKYKTDLAFMEFTQKQSLKEKGTVYHGGRGGFRLRHETILEMNKEIENIYEEFKKRSQREQILYKEDKLIDSTLLVLLAKGFTASDHMKIEEI